MHALVIANFPPKLHRKLKEISARHRRSMPQQALITQLSHLEGFAGAKPFRISEDYPEVFTTKKGGPGPILT